MKADNPSSNARSPDLKMAAKPQRDHPHTEILALAGHLFDTVKRTFANKNAGKSSEAVKGGYEKMCDEPTGIEPAAPFEINPCYLHRAQYVELTKQLAAANAELSFYRKSHGTRNKLDLRIANAHQASKNALVKFDALLKFIQKNAPELEDAIDEMLVNLGTDPFPSKEGFIWPNKPSTLRISGQLSSSRGNSETNASSSPPCPPKVGTRCPCSTPEPTRPKMPQASSSAGHSLSMERGVVADLDVSPAKSLKRKKGMGSLVPRTPESVSFGTSVDDEMNPFSDLEEITEEEAREARELGFANFQG